MNELHFKTILKSYFKMVKFHNITVFDQINAALGEQESLFKNMQKIVSTPNFDH